MLSRLGPTTPYLAMLLPFIVIPSGMGFAIPAMTATILSSVDRSRSGTASAVVNAARQTGGAIGVAIFGAMMGSAPAQIVRGLELASITSVGLLSVAAVLAWKYIRRVHSIPPQTSDDRHDFILE